MRVLLIKTSSMGDLFHTFPALTDAAQAIPGISFDWVVEETFVDIPRWHPQVREIIPVGLRRWRKQLLTYTTYQEWSALRARLRGEHYDLILDAQGLVKSAILGFLAMGRRGGLDFRSARESLASFFYQEKYNVNFEQHAVVRMRQLFAKALGYSFPTSMPAFGIEKCLSSENYVLFVFGTTWHSKQWPIVYWQLLAKQIQAQGLVVKITAYSLHEVAMAEQIAMGNPAIHLLPRLSISEMAEWIRKARAVVSVDTGFGHLAAALDVPTVSLYGATNPVFTGAIGSQSVQLAADFPCSPCLQRECTYRLSSVVKPACYASIPPERVMDALRRLNTFTK